jgi:hypothetical protein
VDSTGLKLGGGGEWAVEKHGTSRRRSWRKLLTGIDTGSGAIVAIELSAKDVDDAARTGALLDHASNRDHVIALRSKSTDSRTPSNGGSARSSCSIDNTSS